MDTLGQQLGEGFSTLGRQLGEASEALKRELRQGNEAVLRQAVQVAVAAEDSQRALAEQVQAAAAATATAEDLAAMKHDATKQVQGMLRGMEQLGSSLGAVQEQGAGTLSAVKALEEQLAAARAQPSGEAPESAESIKSYLTALQQQQLQLHDQVSRLPPLVRYGPSVLCIIRRPSFLVLTA
jgi:uncharacterized protein involved in exopolysaccharide biosynthesis